MRVRQRRMNVSYRSQNSSERILSNLANTPFSITVGVETFQCQSVEGFWQGLKAKGDMRKQVFLLAGLAAKNAGRGKSSAEFEIGGVKYRVGGKEHESLIREAIRQKILQNPNAAAALRESKGTISHSVPSKTKSIFKMEKMLMSIRSELYGH